MTELMPENQTYEQSVVVSNWQGFHVRPSALFVEAASHFSSHITVYKKGSEFNKVNGKSVMGLITLVAQKDSEIVIQAVGEDAKASVENLVKLVRSGFNEE